MKGRYNEKELNETYIGNVTRYDLIYKYYCKYGSKQALGFCCSRAHAEAMAHEFSKRGIPSAAVYSNSNGEYSKNREDAINKLKNGKIIDFWFGWTRNSFYCVDCVVTFRRPENT